MKAVLICPGKRSAVAALAESAPLVKLPMLGKSLLEHWVEHVVALGAKEVLVLASDRPDEVRLLAGDGARWGIRLEVQPEIREVTYEEAYARWSSGNLNLPHPGIVQVMDHVPGFPGWPLFDSYAAWAEAQQELLRRRAVPSLIGLRELAPGVWVGRGTHVASNVQLHAPCWIGERVWLGAKSIIGPGAIVEHEAFVAPGAEITHSLVAPATYVGEDTFVNYSLAWGRQLINWRNNSCLQVPDEFLLCSLRELAGRRNEFSLPAPVVSWLSLWLFWPANAWALIKSKLEGVPAFRRLVVRGHG